MTKNETYNKNWKYKNKNKLKILLKSTVVYKQYWNTAKTEKNKQKGIKNKEIEKKI